MIRENYRKAQEDFATKLFKSRELPQCVLPDKSEVRTFTKEFLQLLFPHFGNKEYTSAREIEAEFLLLRKKLIHILRPLKESITMDINEIADNFCNYSPDIYDKLILDAEAIVQGDPAAENIDEVIVAYPGFLAISSYRLAHIFYKMKVPLFPRIISEYAHQQTGIDIHPGAQIGNGFFIDHGTGIVIGETTNIGDNVKLYQGVTLGALSVDKKLEDTKRHPTIENNVVIYSNATILGGATVIGHDSIIGGNVWLTESVPAYSIVYHKSQIKVRSSKEIEEPINFYI